MASLRDTLRRATAWASGAAGVWQPVTAVSSPWGPRADLAGVVLSGDAGAVLRADGATTIDRALKVPAVARAVAQISASVAQIGLRAEGGEVAWLDGPAEGPVSGAYMWAQCALDLFWTQGTVLAVLERDDAGYPAHVERVPLGLWSMDAAGRVQINGEDVDQHSVIYVPGLTPTGFLGMAGEHIDHYLGLLSTIGSRSRNPIPLIDLHLTEDWSGSTRELEATRDAWAAARQHENGAVAITPRGIDARPMMAGSSDDQAMLIAARNAARLDVANFANLPANMLEGDNGASGTYQNTLQKHSEFIRLSLPLFTVPLAARLSQDDVTPEGVRVIVPLDDLDAAMTDPHGNTTNREQPAPSPAASPAPDAEMPYPTTTTGDQQ